jgi:outer membrane assembly lipoprotein YfiO
MKFQKVLILSLFCIAISSPSYAYWVWSPEKGEFVNPEGKAGQGAAEEQFEYAMKFYNEKNFDEAGKQFEDIAKKYPQLSVAGESLYRLGTIHEEKGDYLKAFNFYKRVIETYPNSERFTEVVEREFRIGNVFLSGKKAKMMGLEILPALPKAAEVFENIVKNAPFSEYGDKAQFHLGLTYKKMGKYEEAVEAFQAVIDKYPQSELATQARFQVAETAYDRSTREFRDQRALDDAAKQVDRFLDKYPDAEVSEKAAKLRQVIDEKNAEKSYRIGAYYEKEKYLSSAVIYYSDVAAKYPNTSWGKKANEKLKVLHSPTEYRTEKEKGILQEMEMVKQQLQSLPESDKQERARLQAQLASLEQQRKNITGQEREGLKSKIEDFKRRESELKEKFKKLDEKKKLFKNNTSDDFQKAMERWHASLVEEKEALEAERQQLSEWEGELGSIGKSFRDYIPFMHEPPSELDKVRRIGANKLYKAAKEKSKLLEKKETLYQSYEQLSQEVGALGAEPVSESPQPSKKAQEPVLQDDWKVILDVAGDDFKAEQEKIVQSHSEVERLQKELAEKTALYQDHYGKPGWLAAVTASANAVAGSTNRLIQPLAFLNPFGGDERKPEDLKPQELVELRMHLKEQAFAEQNLIDSLSQAFDTELALKEQKKIMDSLDSKEKVDPAELRKSIKSLERDIRVRYEEIQDRHDNKQKLLKELDALMTEKKTGLIGMAKYRRTIMAPAVGVWRFGKGFIFGMQNKDEKITEEARETIVREGEDPRIKALKDQIELESIVIEAKSREIAKLRRQLEMLRAKASLIGGFKFRSSMVQVPYEFIGEAVESARRIVPKKNREEILIERLNDETSKLTRIRTELKTVEEIMNRKGIKTEDTPAKMDIATTEGPSAGEGNRSESAADKVSSPEVLKEQINATANQLEVSRNMYEREKAILKNKIQERKGGKKLDEEGFKAQVTAPPPAATTEPAKEETSSVSKKDRKKSVRELNSVREDIMELITKEKSLEGQEAAVLEKRIEAVDRGVMKIKSKAMKQDLLTEKKRMEERLTQIRARQVFLAEELKRFQTQ